MADWPVAWQIRPVNIWRKDVIYIHILLRYTIEATHEMGGWHKWKIIFLLLDWSSSLFVTKCTTADSGEGGAEVRGWNCLVRQDFSNDLVIVLPNAWMRNYEIKRMELPFHGHNQNPQLLRCWFQQRYDYSKYSSLLYFILSAIRLIEPVGC